MGLLLADALAMLGFRFTPEAQSLLNDLRSRKDDLMADSPINDDREVPILGPITITFAPEQAAEIAMLLQHVLYNVPENPRPDQAARAHTLGEAAILLSEALVQAMHDAGLSDEMIARASGHLYRAPQEDAAQMGLDLSPAPVASPELRQENPADQLHDELATPHPLDPPAEPHNPSAPVDFPVDGGPPNAA